MSDDAVTEATEEDRPPSRIAGAVVLLVLAAIAVFIVRAIVTAFPYVAYFIAGVIVTVVGQRSAAWARKRRSDSGEEADEEEPPDVVEALRALSAGGNNVLLSTLRKRLGVADTKAVRKLLKDEKIRVRAGVRTPGGNGPGVHHTDIPAPPPASNEEHGDGCCCRSANNTNANNSDEEPSQKGLTVEAIGQAGKLIRDPAETHQRRTQVSGLVDRFLAGTKQKRPEKR